MENDRLESENIFVFINEADSSNLGLNDVPTYCSCFYTRNEVWLLVMHQERLTIVYPDTSQI